MPASPRVHDLEDGDFVVAHDHFHDVSQLHYDNTIYVFVDSHAKSLRHDRVRKLYTSLNIAARMLPQHVVVQLNDLLKANAKHNLGSWLTICHPTRTSICHHAFQAIIPANSTADYLAMAIGTVAHAAQDIFYQWSQTKDWALPEKCEARAAFFPPSDRAKVISSCTRNAAEL